MCLLFIEMYYSLRLLELLHLLSDLTDPAEFRDRGIGEKIAEFAFLLAEFPTFSG